jgi:hypothetical protein
MNRSRSMASWVRLAIFTFRPRPPPALGEAGSEGAVAAAGPARGDAAARSHHRGAAKARGRPARSLDDHRPMFLSRMRLRGKPSGRPNRVSIRCRIAVDGVLSGARRPVGRTSLPVAAIELQGNDSVAHRARKAREGFETPPRGSVNPLSTRVGRRCGWWKGPRGARWRGAGHRRARSRPAGGARRAA